MAEREGFEPSVRIPYTRLAGECLRPLGHLSTNYYITNVDYGVDIIDCKDSLIILPKSVKLVKQYGLYASGASS